MPRSARAREAAESVPLCVDCVAQEGLCAPHRPHVLPQLKEPSWYRDAHSGREDERQKRRPPRDKTELRNEARRERRATRAARRLGRALDGQFTRSRPRRAAAA